MLGPAGAQRGGIDGPRRERPHRQHGLAVLVAGAQLDRVAAVRDHRHAQRRRAVREDLDARERERQRHAPGLRAGAERVDRGVEGGVEERGVHGVVAGVRARLLERHRRVDLAAAPPDARDALERRAVVEAELGEPVVEAVGVEGLGALRRPLRGGVRGVGLGREVAGGVTGPLELADRPEWIVNARRSSSSGSWTCTCSSYAASPGMTSGACSVSSSSAGRSAAWPACSASSISAVPGSSTVPWTAWSASHGWRLEREPAGEQPFVLARDRDGGGQQRVPVDLGGRLRREPVVLVLEGVGRQVDRAARRGAARASQAAGRSAVRGRSARPAPRPRAAARAAPG